MRHFSLISENIKNMEPIQIPLVPQWNVISACVSTPNDGVLYVGWETINYISKIEHNKQPIMKIFHIRQKIKCLDCDPDWSDTKYFAILAEDNSIQIWDFNDTKAKKGHKAHIRPVLGDGEFQSLEKVKFCYLNSRKVLSIDSASIIIYCPISNTYVKKKRTLPIKHEISIVKGSPYDDNILALGTTRGLVVVTDLKNEKVLYTLRGHDTEITSLSWLAINLQSNQNNSTKLQLRAIAAKRRPLKRSDPTTTKTTATFEITHDSSGGGGDIFDIFDYDYLDDETFGVPNTKRVNETDSDDENAGAGALIELKKATADVIENENFNFVEACQNLKDEILLTHEHQQRQNHDFFNDSNYYQMIGNTLTNTKQVTIFDCKQQQELQKERGHIHSNSSSSSCEDRSRESLELADRSSDDNITVSKDNFDFDNRHHENENNYESGYTDDDNDNANNAMYDNMKEERYCIAAAANNQIRVNDGKFQENRSVFLASGSHEAFAWVWNINTGAAMQKLDLKSSSQNSIINVCWMNDTTLLTNTRSGEITLWKLQQSAILITDATTAATTTTLSSQINFIQENRVFKDHRGIASLCKLRNSEIIWTLSTYREITCEDIAQNKLLAKYSCASSNTAAIRECPDNMNKLAIASTDRRIGIIDLSSLTPYKVSIENFTSKIESAVVSLNWCPNYKLIAYGTNEGRVGVIDTDKPSTAPVTMKPFSGKSVSCVEWCGKQIFACSHEKVAVYEWNGKSADPKIIESVSEASTICIHSCYLLVGTKNGFLNIFKRDTETILDFEKITSTYVAPKYISVIALNPINSQRFAIASLANKITIFSISYESDVLTNERVLTMNDYSSGNAWIKWSHVNVNLLLSCGFDGAIRIWDLSQQHTTTATTNSELIFLKQYQSPMSCGVFSPMNENVIICAGKTTSIEMFDITKEQSSVYHKSVSRKKRNKIATDGVQWATKIQNNNTNKNGSKKEKEKLRKQKQQQQKQHDNLQNHHPNQNNAEEIVNQIDKLVLNEYAATAAVGYKFVQDIITNETSTLFHLIADENNTKALNCLLSILENDHNESDSHHHAAAQDDENKRTILSAKMFGDKKDLEFLLNEELRNHQASKTISIAHNLIPQLNSNLKEEILKLIQTKKLTCQHLALAPTISYGFWKTCCFAYAIQLIENELILQAIPFLLACHEVKECINKLLEKKYYREAWIIGKIYRENDDPILERILENWLGFLRMTGQLESGALICALTKRYEQCHQFLSMRRQPTIDHERILEILKVRLENF